MYFAYGWPKMLSAVEGAGKEETVFLSIEGELALLVSTCCIQIWTGGQHRVKLGRHTRTEASVQAEGLNKRAYWCPSRRLLAVLTYNSHLHIYGLHTSKESVLPSGGLLHGTELKRLDIYLQHSIQAAAEGLAAMALVGDSRFLLLGMSDGSCHLYSWQAKFRGKAQPFGGLSEMQLRVQRNTSSRSLRSMQPAPSGSLGLATMQGPSPRAAPSPTARRGSGGLHRFDSSEHGARVSDRGSTDGSTAQDACIDVMDYAPAAHCLAIVLTDGRCAICRVSEASGLASLDQLDFSHWVCSAGSGATAVALAPAAQLVAVGLSTGEVALYKLQGSQRARFSADGIKEAPVRVVSLLDWGHGPEATGSVADLKWSPDNRALAVGWRRSGLGLWSASGCRLMCSLRQTARTYVSPQAGSSGVAAFCADAAPPLETRIAAVAWGAEGYQLMVAEAASSAHVLELSLAKSLRGSHRVLSGDTSPQDRYCQVQQEVHVLLGSDRLLLITQGSISANPVAAVSGPSREGLSPDLVVHHLRLPQQYISSSWPLVHAALSSDGMDVAVAGTQGLALYSRRSARWRLFGDISQERSVAVQTLLWLPRVVVACALIGGAKKGDKAGCQLLLYPRYHLDNSSLLARYSLVQTPVAMDALGNFIQIAYAPLDVSVLRIDLSGQLTPLGTPTATVTVVRELSIMTSAQPVVDIALVEPRAGPLGTDTLVDAGDLTPRHCVLLRAGGLMSLLDMDKGSETPLAEDIECFWLAGPSPWAQQQSATFASRLQSAQGAQLSRQQSGASMTTSQSLRTSYSGEVSAQWTPQLDPAARQQPGTSTSGRNDSHRMPVPQLEKRHGSQVSLDDSVTDAASSAGQAEVEIPWWTYGPQGMQMWFPSSLAEPLSPSTREAMSTISTDPELEFDREVYPIGISIAEVAIIGVTQRVARSQQLAARSTLPCFHPLPESQPVLPCLLRRLLQQGKDGAAMSLAARHCEAPHFARSLEWLLFTALEINNDEVVPCKPRAQAAMGGSYSQNIGMLEQWASEGRSGPKASGKRRRNTHAGPLLQAAAQLVRQFPQNRDVVVSVARKTDAQMWPALFAAVGVPSSMLDSLLEAGMLQSAACCLLIVDRIEGPQAAHGRALQLIQAALEGGAFELAAELLRFIIPPEDQDILGSPSGNNAEAHANGMAGQEEAGVSSWLTSWLFGSSATQQPKQPAHQAGTAGAAGKPGHDGWQVIACHAGQLLEDDRIRELARLGRALVTVGGHLSSLLVAVQEQPRSPQEPGLNALAVMSALAAATAELPVVGDSAALEDAQMLLEACVAADITSWALALGLVIEDIQTLAGIKQRHGDLWIETKMVLHRDLHLKPYLEVMNAADGVRLSKPLA